MDFVHLKTQTEFSISQGINRIPAMIQKAANNGMGAVAMTDLNGLYGAIGFYKEAREAGVKPLLGVDITVQQDDEDKNTYQLTLIAKNDKGYRKIIELNSRSYIENDNKNAVAIKEEWLGDIHDVIILSGAKQGLIGKMLLADDKEGAFEVAKQMKDYFGEDFYIEFQRDGTPDEEKYMDGVVEISSQLGIAPVATHPCYFTERDDFVAHEARYCIGGNQPLFSMSRERPFNKDMYFKTKEEMYDLFSDLPQALENTVVIAKKCNLSLTLGKPVLPNFPTPNGEEVDDYFATICHEGLKERLLENFPDENERAEHLPQYLDRLNTELDIIKNMKFPGYFLIVGDFITWAKNHDIPVGAGRGSGAGSLVAYAMKITDIDPLPYNLLFERFLNPERVSMPDFDIDFCQARRHEVYDYVREKYGHEAVSHIGTFGTLAARAVVKSVGKTLGYPYGKVDVITRMINIKPSAPITLKQFIFGDESKGIEGDEKMLEVYNNDRDIQKLIDIALKIEGVTKNVGTHAAGVVISPTVLTDFSPLYSTKDGVTTQFNKDDVETAGLVKFDFLGLKNLTTIKEAVDLVNNRKLAKGEDTRFDLRTIPLDDQNVYSGIFARGNTTGIFQFEGKGMTAVIQKAVPKRLEDLIAINALYRPGPMEIIPAWLKAKHLPEDQRSYPDERLREVLKETAGFMIYQEQVMQCAQIIAGFSLGGADTLRRIIGKKKVKDMVEQRELFVTGAAKNGVSEEKATELFDLIDKFSGYGFNKSHAAAYSYIAYQTAYLKQYFPEEFLTANLNSNINDTNTDKIAIIVHDAKNNNVEILSPDVNKSEYTFTIENDGQVRYGLGALKGVGEAAVKAITNEREKNGPFTDFYDFLERASKGKVNKRTIEALVKAGAFNSLHDNNAQLQAAISPGLDYVANFRKQIINTTAPLGNDMFEDEEPIVPVKKKKSTKPAKVVVRPDLPEVEAWDDLTAARNEKSSMGFFFSSNPFNTYYAKQLGGFETATSLAELNDLFQTTLHSESTDDIPAEKSELDSNVVDEMPSQAFVGCMIENIKLWVSKKGAFVTVSDGTSTSEISVFADFLEENKEWFKKDSFAALKLKLEVKFNDKTESEELSMLVQQGFSFDQTKKLLSDRIFVGSEENPDLINKFEEICNEFSGRPEDKDAIAILCVPDATGKRTKPIKKFYVRAEPQFFDTLIKTFGDEWIKTKFKKDLDNVQFPELAYKNKNNKKNGYGNNNKFKKNAFSN